MFGLFESDGCGGHHYGDWEDTEEYTARCKTHLWNDEQQYIGNTENDIALVPHGATAVHVLEISQKRERKCQHSGCFETKERWQDVTFIPFEDLDDLGYNPHVFSEKYAMEELE